MSKNGNVYMTIHADYTQPCYSKYPDFHNPKIKKIFGITQYICDTAKEKFGIDVELCCNPIVLEPPQKRIVLISATRLSAIKGGRRMKALAEALDAEGVNYVWYVFTNDMDMIYSNNVIFLQPRLDVWKWISDPATTAIVQLSDTEACSYTISERTSDIGKVLITTPLPYLKELPHADENIIILNFDLSNIKDVVEKIKSLKSQNNASEIHYENVFNDNYKKYLAKGKSKYEEMKRRMKKIRVKNRFKDMKYNNLVRTVGQEFIEEDARATDLINRGFCVLVEEIKEKVPEVEIAKPKEEKKEKAVKEKAVKPKLIKKLGKK